MDSYGKRIAVTAGLAILAVAAGAWQTKASPLQQRQNAANDNARALSIAIQARANMTREYNDNLASYARELRGQVPINPCTGTRTGYVISVRGKTATVSALKGALCGKWTPKVYALTLLGDDPLSRQARANTNARALATAVQARAIGANKYDANLSSYARDMGGTLPINPCTGTATGYTIVVKGDTASVAAQKGKRCGEWTPMTFNLTL